MAVTRTRSPALSGAFQRNHQPYDTHYNRRGVPLAIQVTGANRNDSQQALTLV